ncbi:MAG: restriction endonuclease subunit S [Actinobacteria bacterium]|nr:restriction endonuclease subunit S [Actinomycetota bacterium]
MRKTAQRTDLELLSVYLDRGVIRYTESHGQVHKPSVDLSNYQHVRPGDLVLNNQQAWRGSVGVSTYEGIVSPAYIVCELSPDIAEGYASRLFRSPEMVDQYVLASKGVGSIQRSLSWPQLRGASFALPPLPDQQLIARYLDNAELRIARAIQAKRHLADLLRERQGGYVSAELRQFVPTSLVGSANSEASPVAPLKTFYRESIEKSVTGSEELLTVSHITGVTRRSEKTVTMFMAKTHVGYKTVKAGDFIINTMWAWMGAMGSSPIDGIVSPSYGVYRPNPKAQLVPEYAELLLRSDAYVDEYNRLSTGVTPSRARLYPPQFLRIPVCVLTLEEQKSAVARLSASIASTAAAIGAIQREIELLREYRNKLISDVVTGKKDIRAEAASMKDVDPAELAAALAGGTPSDDIDLEVNDDAE